MYLFGRFYSEITEASIENDNFQVHHQLNDKEPYSLEAVEHNGKYFIQINRRDQQKFYARPFVCLIGDPTDLELALLNVNGKDNVCYKKASEIEAIETANETYFKRFIQIRFKNNTNILCGKVELLVE